MSRMLVAAIFSIFLPVLSFSELVIVPSPVLGDSDKNPYGTLWFDYDGDSDLDLYVTNGTTFNVGQENSLFRNDGGAFANIGAGAAADAGNGRGVCVADKDGDGDLDLLLVNRFTVTVMLENDGTGNFSDVTPLPLQTEMDATDVSWIDFNNDGLLDIYIFTSDEPNRLFRNEGGGSYSALVYTSLNDSMAVGGAWGDYDNDGDLDLYWANSDHNKPNKMLRNDGVSMFAGVTGSPINLLGTGHSASWGDFNNDGYLDLIASVDGCCVKLFRNRGDGTFARASGLFPHGADSRGTSWSDYDNDGDLDLFLFRPNLLFRNEGGASFADVTTPNIVGNGSPLGATWGDYDDDGDLDLYFVDGGGANRLLRNDVDVANNWIHLRLHGTVSNASAIGARVICITGADSQVREIGHETGPRSQNSLCVEFGLGATQFVDTLIIRWPSGLEERYLGLSANSKYEFMEGDVATNIGLPGRRQDSIALRAYPNPFPAETKLRFLAGSSEFDPVDVTVYDIRGRMIRRLLEESILVRPGFTTTWDGRDDSGKQVPPGVYLIRLDSGSRSESRKITLIR